MNSLASYYGINDPIFAEYLRTLGVRAWAGNGSSKLAYEQIQCELASRGWCSTVNCVVNSIPDALGYEPFTLFPSPATEIVNISGLEKPLQLKQIRIRDTQGRVVHELSNGQYTQGIDVAHLGTGYYHMTLITTAGGRYGSSFMLVD